jgi:hypothetical protein
MEPSEIARRAREAADGVRDLGRRCTENPVSAVLTALAAGFLLGLVLRLFERPRRERGEE